MTRDEIAYEKECRKVWLEVAIAVSRAEGSHTSDIPVVWADKIMREYRMRFSVMIPNRRKPL